MLPAAIEAISNDDLETAMQIVGVKSIEELVYLTEGRGNTLLSYAAQLGRAKPIKVLLSKVLDPQKLMLKKNNNGYTALIIAASLGYAKAITAMLKGVDNPQQLAEQIDDINGATALHYAAVYGHAGAITAMLKGVGNPQQLAEQIDAKGATALHHAAKNGHEAVATAILSNVSNRQQLAEQQTIFGSLALSAAASRGHIGVITSIFSLVSNPQQLAEQQSINGSTAIMYAVNSSESTLIITKILESVVDTEKLIFQVHNEGLNSFTHALKKGNMDAAELLFDKAKDKTALLLKKNNPDQPAGIEMMEQDILKKFLEKYNNLNQ
jgi:ankyrin repeat protein